VCCPRLPPCWGLAGWGRPGSDGGSGDSTVKHVRSCGPLCSVLLPKGLLCPRIPSWPESYPAVGGGWHHLYSCLHYHKSMDTDLCLQHDCRRNDLFPAVAGELSRFLLDLSPQVSFVWSEFEPLTLTLIPNPNPQKEKHLVCFLQLFFGRRKVRPIGRKTSWRRTGCCTDAVLAQAIDVIFCARVSA